MGPLRQPMTVVMLLADPQHPLVSAVVERGMMEGLTFTTTSVQEDALKHEHKAMLQAFPGGFQPQRETTVAEWSIEIAGAQSPPANCPIHRRMTVQFDHRNPTTSSEHLVVFVHDMLPPTPVSEEADLFAMWLTHIKENTKPDLRGDQRYWCDRFDVAYGVVELLKGKPKEPSFHLAGRRAWTLEETWMEFADLARRARAGQTGRFEVDHLVAKGVPSVKAVSVEAAANRHERPDLGAIHRFLKNVDGEGWRPKTPLRQSLMFVLADLNERQDA